MNADDSVINVNAYPLLAFSDLKCHLDNTGICLLVAVCRLTVRGPNLEVTKKRLLHQYQDSFSTMLNMEVCRYSNF